MPSFQAAITASKVERCQLIPIRHTGTDFSVLTEAASTWSLPDDTGEENDERDDHGGTTRMLQDLRRASQLCHDELIREVHYKNDPTQAPATYTAANPLPATASPTPTLTPSPTANDCIVVAAPDPTANDCIVVAAPDPTTNDCIVVAAPGPTATLPQPSVTSVAFPAHHISPPPRRSRKRRRKSQAIQSAHRITLETIPEFEPFPADAATVSHPPSNEPWVPDNLLNLDHYVWHDLNSADASEAFTQSEQYMPNALWVFQGTTGSFSSAPLHQQQIRGFSQQDATAQSTGLHLNAAATHTDAPSPFKRQRTSINTMYAAGDWVLPDRVLDPMWGGDGTF